MTDPAAPLEGTTDHQDEQARPGVWSIGLVVQSRDASCEELSRRLGFAPTRCVERGTPIGRTGGNRHELTTWSYDIDPARSDEEELSGLISRQLASLRPLLLSVGSSDGIDHATLSIAMTARETGYVLAFTSADLHLLASAGCELSIDSYAQAEIRAEDDQ